MGAGRQSSESLETEMQEDVPAVKVAEVWSVRPEACTAHRAKTQSVESNWRELLGMLL